MTRTSSGFLAVLFAWMITASPAIASQAQVVAVDPATGLVTVESNGVPLQALLEQMSTATPFALLRLESDIREQPVHVSIRSVSVKEAVTKILIAAGAGFAISGPENGHGLRVAAAREKFVETLGSSASLEKTLASDRADEVLVKPEDAAAESTATTEEVEAVEADKDQGSVSATREELAGALTGKGLAAQRGGSILLPFPSAGGGVMTAVPATPGTIIELPFAGPGGAPITAVVPPRGAAVQLPIVATPPSTAKATPKREGISPKDDKF